MNLHAAAAYATHLLKARSTAGHGVHSPFMFRFITEVMGGRNDRAIQREVEGLRREMLVDRREVRVRDLGAGSVVMGKGERSVRKIAFAAAVPKRETALLARIAGSLDKIRSGGAEIGHQSGVAGTGHRSGGSETGLGSEIGGTGHRSGEESEAVTLELGTSLGISTLALALGAPHRRVISVEGCPEVAAIALENLRQHGAHNAEVLCMEFGEALALLRNRGTKVALAFIDGNHRGTALTDYVHMIREMGEEMIIIADDIHMNRDMMHAWRSLQSGNLAPASLETLRMGMLFCLRNLTPGNYRVR